jgi:hypothetical protein
VTQRTTYLILAVLVLAALTGGYVLYWRYVAGQLEQGVQSWAEQERVAGREVAFTTDGIVGFPFAFRQEFADIAVQQPLMDGMLVLRTERAVATIRPWNLHVIEVVSERPVSALLTTPDQGAASLALAEGRGTIRLRSDGRLEELALDIGPYTFEMGGQRHEADNARLILDLPPLTPRSHTDPFLTFALDFGDLVLPAGQRALTTGPIKQLAIAGTILGPIPADQPPRSAVAQWARNGGTVELSHFAFVQAPLDLAGEGTLALDANQQLLGALTIRAQGLTETIDLLAGEGLIEAKAATTGRMMAEGLAKTDDKGRKVVSISLSLQQGFVWLGPIRLVPLPVLAW